jgi:hypothetical protein
MASKDLKLSKHGTAGKRKHVTLTVPQKLDAMRLESGESQSEVMASIQHWIINSPWYKEMKGPITFVYGMK